MGKYKTKIEQPQFSPHLGQQIEPGQELELDDKLAAPMCDHTETVQYPPEQQRDMEAQGFKVKVEEATCSADEIEGLRKRGFRVSDAGKYRVAVGSRKVKGILSRTKATTRTKAK